MFVFREDRVQEDQKEYVVKRSQVHKVGTGALEGYKMPSKNKYAVLNCLNSGQIHTNSHVLLPEHFYLSLTHFSMTSDCFV